jgi:amidase
MDPSSLDDVDLETATVSTLEALLDSGRTTSREVAQAYIARIEAVDIAAPGLRAVRALNPRLAAETAAATDARRRPGAHAPLLGIPVMIKDNIDVAGMPTTAGSIALAGSEPVDDAALVRRLRDAGAVIMGKANLTEFANFMTDGMPSGYSSLAGQVLNPYDTSITPSGSSAGSAVAVAAGLAPLAVGTETNGSILSPANANSVVGIKPTVGLVSRTGILPIASSQDTAGPLATTVRDAARLLAAMCGPDRSDPATAAAPAGIAAELTAGLSAEALRGVRLGVAGPAPAGSEAAWAAAQAILTEQGATLVPVQLDEDAPGMFVLTYEFKRDLDAYLGRLGPEARVRSLAEIVAYNESHAGAALKFGQTKLVESLAVDLDDPATVDRYRQARADDLRYSRGQLDALLAGRSLDALLFAAEGSSDLGARAGYPSISVPAGYTTDARRPFGITLLGRAYSEPDIIGFGYAFEQAAGARRPPSSVNPASWTARPAR